MAKKILLINGGGMFGIVPAFFLDYVKDYTGHDFRENLDCLAGSSIGGILAAIYACGHQPTAVLHSFEPACKEIFSKRFVAKLNPLAAPRYDDDALKKFIYEFVGDRTIGDTKFNYPNMDMFFAGLDVTDDSFKVWDNITGKDDHERLKDICRITCAAPTYFDAVDRDGHAMVDCGLIENTMLMTTTIGYKTKRNVPFEEMDVLLIGTGFLEDEKPLDFKRYNSLNQLGILFNLIIPYVTQSNELASIYWARGLGLRNFYYYNPVKIHGELDETWRLKDVVEDCKHFGSDFIKTWNNFMSDEKKDPVKDVRDLIVLPRDLGESYYKKVEDSAV